MSLRIIPQPIHMIKYCLWQISICGSYRCQCCFQDEGVICFNHFIQHHALFALYSFFRKGGGQENWVTCSSLPLWFYFCKSVVVLFETTTILCKIMLFYCYNMTCSLLCNTNKLCILFVQWENLPAQLNTMDQTRRCSKPSQSSAPGCRNLYSWAPYLVRHIIVFLLQWIYTSHFVISGIINIILKWKSYEETNRGVC